MGENTFNDYLKRFTLRMIKVSAVRGMKMKLSLSIALPIRRSC